MVIFGTVIEDLATYDKSIWEKIKDFIVDLIKKIKKAYGELSPNSQAAKVLKETVDDMSEIQRLWAEGVREAGERTRKAEAESVTRMNEEKMYVIVYKIADENKDNSIKDQLRTHSSQLEEMAAVDTVNYSPMNKKQLHEKVSDKFKSIGYKVERQNFGIIEIGEKQIDKSINYINTEGEKAALLAIPSVLKRGIVVDGHDNHKNRDYDTITIAAPIEVNGTRGIVGAVVTKIEGKNKYRVHRILTPDGSEFVFETKRKDTEPTSGEPLSNDKHAPIGSASKKSIAQPDDSVKRKFSISDDETDETPAPFAEAEARMEAEAAARAEAETEDGEIPDVDEFEDGEMSVSTGRRYALPGTWR